MCDNNEKRHTDKKRSSIYDGIEISERGINIIVISLSALLIVFFIAALITA